MKTVLKICAVLLLIVLAAGVWAINKYPFLAPGYRSKYPAGDYHAMVDSSSKPATAATMMQTFEAMYPFWLGTRWNFNGISETPGEGSVACGYFVTTMMRDMHYNIDRIKLAQCASEEMIKALVDKDHISRFNLKENTLMFDRIKDKGHNLYIIGLDNHTGFIYNDGSDIWFIHSSGSFPYRVIKVKAEDCKTITNSKYKVLGCISQSNILIPG